MAGNAYEASREEELDWDNMSNPIPLDMIDPDFQSHAATADLPGSRSEILPRAESEAFAAAHDATLQMPDQPVTGAPPAPSPAQSSAMPAHTPPERTPVPDPTSQNAPVLATPTVQMPARGVPSNGSSGGTTFGDDWPRDQAEIQDEFARIRAKMEAESETEKQAKQAADKEEASQRERLDQWMTNARNRLIKADADLTGPSGRIRIRKDHSPSLYRLAEMQKTIWVEGQATQADSPTSSLRALDRENRDGREKAAPPPLDPMATISVPTEQFLTLDAPAQPTLREQAIARHTAQQAAHQATAHQGPAVSTDSAKAVKAIKAVQPPRPAENALSAHTAPQPAAHAEGPQTTDARPPQSRSLGETAYHPMTREEALTRKVALLRKVAEGGDNTLAMGPGDSPPERTALHFAIAAVVIVAIAVLGIGLFAATQAGLFDGLENRVPFLRPDAPAPSTRLAAKPAPANPVASAPASTVKSSMPDAGIAPGNQPGPALPREPAAASLPRPVPQKPAPQRPAAAVRPPAKAVKPAPKPSLRPEPIRRAAVTPIPAADELPPARAATAVAAAAAIAATDATHEKDEGEIPAYAKPRAKAANLGEIILRASVQAATNIDKDNLLEMYNRYALGFPGLSGEVVIGLMVDPGGRILEGSIVNSTTGAEAFDQELLRKVLDWRLRAFPESRPKFITVPFLFPLQGR